jgi:hypothetical protein
MDTLTTLGRTLGFSFAAGINLYATVAILGLASRYAWVDLPKTVSLPLQITHRVTFRPVSGGPELTIETERKLGSLAVLPLRDVQMRRPIFLVWRKGRVLPKAAGEFLELLRGFVDKRLRPDDQS